VRKTGVPDFRQFTARWPVAPALPLSGSEPVARPDPVADEIGCAESDHEARDGNNEFGHRSRNFTSIAADPPILRRPDLVGATGTGPVALPREGGGYSKIKRLSCAFCLRNPAFSQIFARKLVDVGMDVAPHQAWCFPTQPHQGPGVAARAVMPSRRHCPGSSKGC
jgi:hypothetical protein